MRRPAVSILVPVYNEAPRLPALLRALGRLRLAAEIVAVDDGSTDGSLDLLRRWRRRGVHGRFAKVLVHGRNRGKGAAILTALRAARGRAVVLLDADLECTPGDIPRLLAALARHPNAAIFGTRFPRKVGVFESSKTPGVSSPSGTRFPHKPVPAEHGDSTSVEYPGTAPAGPMTRLANAILTGTTNLLFGASLTDMACGYKAMAASSLRSLGLRATRFELEAELTAGLLRRHVPIVEVPVRYTPRSYRQGKKIHPLDGLRILWTLVRLRLRPRPRVRTAAGRAL